MPVGGIFLVLICCSMLMFVLLTTVYDSLTGGKVCGSLFFRVTTFLLFLMVTVESRSMNASLPGCLSVMGAVNCDGFDSFLDSDLSFPKCRFN